MNLYEYTYDIVRQIPQGKISTYGAVAKALGDIRAARAVGRMMNQNPDADTMPCFKIVQTDGHLGGFGLGISDKIRRLQEDGLTVADDVIEDFSQVLFDDFKTDFPLKKLREEQIHLSKRLNMTDQIKEKDIRYVAGFDVAYSFNDDWAESCGACVVYDYNTLEIVEKQIVFHNTHFPYIPTYLSFRELPFIQKLMKTLTTSPSVLMFDGNGILHPYQFGLACHAGVTLDIASIGVAKSLLVGKQQPDHMIIHEGSNIGYAYYSHSRVKKPVFISQGNKISLETAINVVKKLSTHKQPEPLRQAHILATDTLRQHLKNPYSKQQEHLMQHTTALPV